jgi:hypothetical protein
MPGGLLSMFVDMPSVGVGGIAMSDEGVSESVRMLVEPLEAEPLTERCT